MYTIHCIVNIFLRKCHLQSDTWNVFDKVIFCSFSFNYFTGICSIWLKLNWSVCVRACVSVSYQCCVNIIKSFELFQSSLGISYTFLAALIHNQSAKKLLIPKSRKPHIACHTFAIINYLCSLKVQRFIVSYIYIQFNYCRGFIMYEPIAITIFRKLLFGH